MIAAVQMHISRDHPELVSSNEPTAKQTGKD
jgi:hypothetical protein